MRRNKRLWPDVMFWSRYIRKIISITVSLKVLLFLTATLLLKYGYITDTNWVTVTGIILGARLGNQLMFNHKNGYTEEEKQISKDLGV